MSVGQRIEHRPDDLYRLERCLPPLFPDEVTERGAGDVLENEVEIAPLLAGLEDWNNVRMTQLADQTRLGKQLPVLLGVRTREMQRLDRHFALKMRIARQIDDALGTTSQFADYLETPYLPTHAARLKCVLITF